MSTKATTTQTREKTNAHAPKQVPKLLPSVGKSPTPMSTSETDYASPMGNSHRHAPTKGSRNGDTNDDRNADD